MEPRQSDRQRLNQTHRQAEKSNNLSKAETKKEEAEMEGGQGEPPPRSRHALAVLIMKTKVASSIKFYAVHPGWENNNSFSSPPHPVPLFFSSKGRNL